MFINVKHQQPYTNNINNNDIKTQLAIDIYKIYKNSVNNCIHIQSPFIDWYLILRIGEDASIVTIRQQYHKLALLLHPDKNKHPKAEFSFKLISQAYKCLSDNTRRSSFNIDRRRHKNICPKCNRTPPGPPIGPHQPTRADNWSTNKNMTPRDTRNNFDVLREKLTEEAKVIKNCMRMNRASKPEDYPVFDPSNYANVGYPHTRNQQFSAKKNFHSTNTWKNFSFDQRIRCENPVFELRTGCRNINVNSSCVTS